MCAQSHAEAPHPTKDGPRWSLQDKTVLITGSSDGLGRATALRIAAQGARLMLHGRDRERLEATAREIRDQAGNPQPGVFIADFSSLAEVRRLAAEVQAATDRLDVLVNNAGIGGLAERRQSADGFELQFAVNYLAGFLLTLQLVPNMRHSEPARIVNVSSKGQHPIDFNNVMLEGNYELLPAYRQSKLAQILFTIELDERLRAAGETGVTVNALHPAALMDTKLTTQWWGTPLTSVDEGAEALVRLIASASLDGVSGRYFEGLSEASALEQAYDPTARARLWKLSEEWTGVRLSDLERSVP